MERELIKIGKKAVVNGITYFCPEYRDNGMEYGTYYKDEDAFWNHPKEVCYIPEAAFEYYADEEESNYIEIEGKKYYSEEILDTYTREDFESMIGDEDDYAEDADGDEITAEILFYGCKWQCPETYLKEI